MAKSRLNFRLSTRQKSLIEIVAAKLEMTKSEVMRHIINYGLSALLKFETGGKIKLNDLLNPEKKQEAKDETQEDDSKPKGYRPLKTPKEEADYQEKMDLANTRFFTEE